LDLPLSLHKYTPEAHPTANSHTGDQGRKAARPFVITVLFGELTEKINAHIVSISRLTPRLHKIIANFAVLASRIHCIKLYF